MATLVFAEVDWHDGEKRMHALMKAPIDQDNPTVPSLSGGAASLLERSPLLAVGAVDEDGRIWASLWGGEAGFARGLPQSHIALKVPVDRQHDPAVAALVGKRYGGLGMIDGVQGKMLSGLAIDLERRKRVKLFGRVAAGALADYDNKELPSQGLGQIQLLVKIEESLGNCPKYLNSRHIVPASASPILISDSPDLPEEALLHIAKADLFFVSSANLDKTMDTNHRGGPPGFIRSVSSKSDSTQIIWPEYSGNRLYQTLGNLLTHPSAGIVIPDLESGDVLYASGRTEVLAGSRAAALIPGSNLAVRLHVESARYVKGGLPYRGSITSMSPYNPRVRLLATESKKYDGDAEPDTHKARLVRKELITSQVARFTFTFVGGPPKNYPKPGQWVALDFADHLDEGYSHMRDADPTSINDDFVRTFTVSSSPPREPSQTPADFSITIRNVGRVTRFLFEYDRPIHLEIGVRGFGGDFDISLPATGRMAFIASGIGITPLLPALPNLDPTRVRLFWSLAGQDLPLAESVLSAHPLLAKSTTIYSTAKQDRVTGLTRALQQAGVDFRQRRLGPEDLAEYADVEKWYMCASPGLSKAVLQWLPDEEIIHESFSY